MHFVSTDHIVHQALQTGIIQQDDAGELRSYLEAYDVALDGRADDGFFEFQMRPEMRLTMNRFLSKGNTLVARSSGLDGATFESNEEVVLERAIASVAATFTPGPLVKTPLETASSTAAALLLSPLLLLNIASGCAMVNRPDASGKCGSGRRLVTTSSGSSCESICRLPDSYPVYNASTGMWRCEKSEKMVVERY